MFRVCYHMIRGQPAWPSPLLVDRPHSGVIPWYLHKVCLWMAGFDVNEWRGSTQTPCPKPRPLHSAEYSKNQPPMGDPHNLQQDGQGEGWPCHGCRPDHWVGDCVNHTQVVGSCFYPMIWVKSCSKSSGTPQGNSFNNLWEIAHKLSPPISSQKQPLAVG